MCTIQITSNFLADSGGHEHKRIKRKKIILLLNYFLKKAIADRERSNIERYFDKVSIKRQIWKV